MDLNFGINGNTSVQAARPITVNSSTPIGVLGIAASNHGLHKCNNAEEAGTFMADKGGNIELINGLKGIALTGVNCPIILNLCADEADVVDALDKFKRAEGLTGINLQGGLIIAPVLSAVLSVATKMDAVADVTHALALPDNFSEDEAGTNEWIQNFGTSSSLIMHGMHNADGVDVACSALYAGTIALYDAKPFGWAKSHSNRAVKGVSGSHRPIEYLDGKDCEARRMRQKGFAMIVRDVGWRTYGFETTHIDPVWQSLDRVRTFQRLLAAITKASKWARDREANELLYVKQSVVEFANELKGNDVIIGFDVYFDSEKNTKATVTAGKFYLTVLISDMPSVRELINGDGENE